MAPLDDKNEIFNDNQVICAEVGLSVRPLYIQTVLLQEYVSYVFLSDVMPVWTPRIPRPRPRLPKRCPKALSHFVR